MVTSAITLPRRTDLTVAGSWLRALSMADSGEDEEGEQTFGAKV
jgi:hypothetical protein